jgi:hypothetical protein
MDKDQLNRFRQAVKQKARRAKEASRRPPRVAGKAGIRGDEPELTDPAYPPDERDVRAKSTGKGHKTADKWNQ